MDMVSRYVLVLVALCATSPTPIARAQASAVDSSIVVRTRPPLRPALRALDARLGRVGRMLSALERDHERERERDDLDGLPPPWDAHARDFVAGDRLAFARLAFAHGSASSAADAFDEVAGAGPLEPADALRRASAHATNGSTSDAIEALEGIDEPRVAALRAALKAAEDAERARDEDASGLDLERALVAADLVTPELVVRLGRDFFIEDARARARLDLLADALRVLGDHEGALLALAARDELPDPRDVDRAVELVQRGNAAHEEGRRDEAIAAWREVIDRHPTTCGWGIAVFNVGVALKEASRWAEAIPVFEALIASDVDDGEPGGNVMEATRDYHHRAALELSTCHEQLEAWGQALAWAVAARDRFPSASWCGNCADSDEAELAARVERITTRMR